MTKIELLEKKIYKIKITPTLKNKLKSWWALYLSFIEDTYWEAIQEMEKKMAKDTGIKDIEFFHTDNGVVGIGNASRTMPLIQREELE